MILKMFRYKQYQSLDVPIGGDEGGYLSKMDICNCSNCSIADSIWKSGVF